MKICKYISSLLLVVMLLGFTRAYAIDFSSMGNIFSNSGGTIQNEEAQSMETNVLKYSQQYSEIINIKKQVEAAKNPSDALSILATNSSKLGMKTEDVQKLGSAFTNINTIIQSGSDLQKALRQLQSVPSTVTSDPQVLSNAQKSIEDAKTALEQLKQAAENLKNNSSGSSTGNNIGDTVGSAVDQAITDLTTLQQANASGNPVAIQAASSQASASLGAVNSATGNLSTAIVAAASTTTNGPAEYAMGIKNWESQTSSILQNSYSATDIQTQICDQMFIGDERNLFKDVICSLIKVVSASTAQFSTQMTCTIQRIPGESNYLVNTDFTYDQGRCLAANTSFAAGVTDHIYGTEGTSALLASTGFYAGENSVLTNSLTGGGTKTTFDITKWILAFAVMGVLILLSFANILNIDINTYAIKKAMPKVVVALVGGWLSLTMVALISKFVDITYQLNIFSPYQSLHPMANIFMGNFGASNATNATLASSNLSDGISLIFDIGGRFLGDSTPSFASMLLGSFFLLVPAVSVLIFEYTLALRPFIVGILAAAGPLAFASLVLPQTQFLFRKWWSYLLVALFYPLAVNFTFFFLNKIDGSYGNGAFFAIWSFKIFIILLLVRMPFTIESDVRRISQKIAATGFGSTLGLGKLTNKRSGGIADKSGLQGAGGKNSFGERTREVIVPVSRKLFRGITTQSAITNTSTQNTLQNSASLPSNIARLISQAHLVNSGRDGKLIQKSIEDMSGSTLKAVVDKSDLQLWRDTRLIEQLKSKDGQKLDDQGAAIRADSVRKALRFAQVSENNKLANGDIIKMLAGKGILSSLPQGIVKKAIEENVIRKEDLIPSYGPAYKNILDKGAQEGSLLSGTRVRELMAQDKDDYLTGFNEIQGTIDKAKANTSGASAGTVVDEILKKIRSGGTSNLMKNSDYFMQRLSGNKNQAISSLSNSLIGAGVESKTAASLAQNTALKPDDINKYIPRQNQNADTAESLREACLSRDVSDGLISEIGGIITQEKVTSSRGIVQKIAENFKSDGSSSISGTKGAIEEVIGKLNGPLAPSDIDSLASEVSKYHPGTKIKTNQKYDQTDIEQIKERAEEVLQTTDSLQKAGLDEKQVSKDTEFASKAVEREVVKNVQQKAKGALANDTSFDQNLNVFSKVVKGQGKI